MSSADQFRRRRLPPKNNSNPFDDDTVDNNDTTNAYSVGRSGGGSRGDTNTSGNNVGRRTSTSSSNPAAAAAGAAGAATAPISSSVPHDPLLDLYEHRLQTNVDPDFFFDPSKFQALNRIIDIIHAEIAHHGGNITPGSIIHTDNFSHLPPYQNIVNQRKIVEEAIEHMAVKHCADLNSSVAAVGRMSRQFDEAKLRVRNLRRQVRDVKDSLKLGDLGGVDGGGVSMSCVLFFVEACLSLLVRLFVNPKRREERKGQNSSQIIDIVVSLFLY